MVNDSSPMMSGQTPPRQRESSTLGVRTSVILVSDLQRSRKFYEQTLGLEVRKEHDNNGWIELGPEQALGRITLREAASGENTGGPTGMVLVVDNLYRFYDETRGKIEYLDVPHRLDWGGVVVNLLDPDGNEITLMDKKVISKWLLGA